MFFLKVSLDVSSLVTDIIVNKNKNKMESSAKKFNLTGMLIMAGSVALGLTIFTLVDRHFLSKM